MPCQVRNQRLSSLILVENIFWDTSNRWSISVSSGSTVGGIFLSSNVHTEFRLLHRQKFLLATVTRQSAGIGSHNMFALVMVCQKNPLFYASRKSNQYAALCIRLHFNVYGSFLASFGSCRGVSIGTSMGFTAVPPSRKDL